MAIFNASIKIFCRAEGQSATAAAAYRAGVCLPDDRTGLVHDYSKRGDVEGVRFYAPQNAPAWASDAVLLWNAAEAADARRNSRTARELEVALPSELDAAQRRALVDELGNMLVGRYSVAVMGAIHAPTRQGDQRNHHVHFLFTTRVMGTDGLGAKTRLLDDKKTGPIEVAAIRASVSDLINAHLSSAGFGQRVDHRSLFTRAQAAADAGDAEVVMHWMRAPRIHLGKAATALERRGVPSQRGAANAAIERDNRLLFSEFVAATRGSKDQIRVGVAYGAKGLASLVPKSRPLWNAGPVRVARGRGRDADVVNAQAALVESSIRASQDNARAYVDGLRRADADLKRLVDAYARAAALAQSDAEQLLERCRRERYHSVLLRRAVEVHALLEEAKRDVERQRDDYGPAIIATRAARLAVERHEQTAPPPRWKPKSRRQWAELRREERAELADAEAREQRAARPDLSPVKMAEAQWDALEARRRAELPLGSEAAVQTSGNKPAQKLPVDTPSSQLTSRLNPRFAKSIVQRRPSFH